MNKFFHPRQKSAGKRNFFSNSSFEREISKNLVKKILDKEKNQNQREKVDSRKVRFLNPKSFFQWSE